MKIIGPEIYQPFKRFISIYLLDMIYHCQLSIYRNFALEIIIFFVTTMAGFNLIPQIIADSKDDSQEISETEDLNAEAFFPPDFLQNVLSKKEFLQ